MTRFAEFFQRARVCYTMRTSGPNRPSPPNLVRPTRRTVVCRTSSRAEKQRALPIRSVKKNAGQQFLATRRLKQPRLFTAEEPSWPKQQDGAVLLKFGAT